MWCTRGLSADRPSLPYFAHRSLFQSQITSPCTALILDRCHDADLCCLWCFRSIIEPELSSRHIKGAHALCRAHRLSSSRNAIVWRPGAARGLMGPIISTFAIVQLVNLRGMLLLYFMQYQCMCSDQKLLFFLAGTFIFHKCPLNIAAGRRKKLGGSCLMHEKLWETMKVSCV